MYLQYYLDNFNSSDGTTTIDYSIATSSDVMLWISSECEDTVKIFVDEYLSPGNYSITWDGINMNGELVLNGMYKFHLTADGYYAEINIFKNSSFTDFNGCENELGCETIAITNDDGYFTIPWECLSFGDEYMATDEFGNQLGASEVSILLRLLVESDEGIGESPYFDADSLGSNELYINLIGN